MQFKRLYIPADGRSKFGKSTTSNGGYSYGNIYISGGGGGGTEDPTLRQDLGTKEDTALENTAFGRIKAINDILGTPGDISTDNTAFGRIEFNYQSIEDLNLVLNEYGNEIAKIGGDLGEPTDDGSTAGQTDTAFGRIKKLENGDRPSLLTLSPVIQKNCFYLDPQSNPDSKAINVKNFENIMFYYGQDPLCSVPVVVRPNQDFNGVWPAINVIPQVHPGDPYKQFSSTIISFIKKDYTVDEKYKIWTYEAWKDGRVDFIDKKPIEGGSAGNACIYIDTTVAEAKTSNSKAFKTIQDNYKGALPSPVMVKENMTDIGGKVALNVRLSGEPVTNVNFYAIDDKDLSYYSMTADGIVSKIFTRFLMDQDTLEQFYYNMDYIDNMEVSLSDRITALENTTPGGAGQKQYIIKTKRRVNGWQNKDTPIFTIIENIDKNIVNNPDYRICLLHWRRRGSRGNKWAIPMFCGEWDVNTGVWNQAIASGIKQRTTKYEWADTWWPIHFGTTSSIPDSGPKWFSNPQATHNTLSSMINLNINSISHQFHNHNKKMRYGVAIFKKTGKGKKGWTRVSNIAEIEIYAAGSISGTPDAMIKVIE